MNRLRNIEAFKKVLRDYQLSAEAKEILANIELVLLVGPSSSGRNTIINQLVEAGFYHYLVSDTTRQPRINNGVLEQNGREYWFRSEEDILADLQAGKFLEAAIIHNQQVSGMSVRELEFAAKEHKIAINEIEVVGADNVHAASPSARFLFIVPPSFDEWITRMNARGTLPADETKRRLESAVEELTVGLARDYYTFVVNDTFMHTSRYVDAIVRDRLVDDKAQTEAKEVARQLLTDTKQFLAQIPQVAE